MIIYSDHGFPDDGLMEAERELTKKWKHDFIEKQIHGEPETEEELDINVLFVAMLDELQKIRILLAED